MSVGKCVVNYFKKHIHIFFISIIVIILVTLISLLPPQLLKIIVDDINNKNTDCLLMYALLYVLIYFSMGIINFLKEILLIIISQGVGKNIRLEMLNKINKMTYTNFSQYDNGKLEAFFSNDVDEINTLITSGVISMFIDSFKIIGIIISIFIFSYMFGLMTLLVIPLIVLFTLWIRKRMYKAQLNNRKLEGSINSLVLENLDNVVTIKSFRIFDKIKNKYNEVLNNHFKTNQKVNTYDSIFSPIMQIMKTTLIVLIICCSSINISLFNMSVGMLVSSIDLITNLFSPIENLGMELQTIQNSLAAIDRINTFFKLKEDDEKLKLKYNEDDVILKFEDVSFSYDNKENVIEHFNLELKNNQRIVLKGRSGSGKSTLFKLAYGLIKPTSGRVIINDIDTYLLPNEIKNKYFGIVYQDYFFSNGTIKEEITLLNNNISEEKIYEALKLVGLTRINDINKKLNINDYSTGELSLFNIARAIVLDSKILFLDEMNAKIDYANAQNIIKVIDKISNDKIVLSINHYGELLNNSEIINLEKQFDK